MADITLTVVGSTVGTIKSMVTISSQDSDRLLEFLLATYGTDADGNSRTPQKMIEAYWAAVTAGTISNVTNYEREQAAKNAREAVTDITLL